MGRPPRPLRAGLFCSIIEIFRVRPSPCRLLKIAIRSWRSRLSKSADFGGAFIPLRASCFPMQKTFCAAENTACYLPFANMFRPLVGRTIEPAAVKTGKAAPIYVGIVTATKIPTDSIRCIIVDCATQSHFNATSSHSKEQADNRAR